MCVLLQPCRSACRVACCAKREPASAAGARTGPTRVPAGAAGTPAGAARAPAGSVAGAAKLGALTARVVVDAADCTSHGAGETHLPPAQHMNMETRGGLHCAFRVHIVRARQTHACACIPHLPWHASGLGSRAQYLPLRVGSAEHRMSKQHHCTTVCARDPERVSRSVGGYKVSQPSRSLPRAPRAPRGSQVDSSLAQCLSCIATSRSIKLAPLLLRDVALSITRRDLQRSCACQPPSAHSIAQSCQLFTHHLAGHSVRRCVLCARFLCRSNAEAVKRKSCSHDERAPGTSALRCQYTRFQCFTHSGGRKDVCSCPCERISLRGQCALHWCCAAPQAACFTVQPVTQKQSAKRGDAQAHPMARRPS